MIERGSKERQPGLEPCAWSALILLLIAACGGARDSSKASAGAAVGVEQVQPGAVWDWSVAHPQADIPRTVAFHLPEPAYDAEDGQPSPPTVVIDPPVPFRSEATAPDLVEVTFMGPLKADTDYRLTLRPFAHFNRTLEMKIHSWTAANAAPRNAEATQEIPAPQATGSLGLSARLSNERIVVLVTANPGGDPIGGAQVDASTPDGLHIGGGRSEPDGLASFLTQGFPAADARSVTRLIITAVRDHDQGSLRIERSSVTRAPKLYGPFTTDRRLYRPGDTVHFVSAPRFETGTGDAAYFVPEQQQGLITLYGPDGSVVKSRPLAAGILIHAEVALPTLAPKGHYRAVFALGTETLSSDFDVGDYSPADLRVAITAPPSVSAGAPLRAEVQAEDLAGFPLPGQHVAWTLEAGQQTAFDSQRFPDANFDEGGRDLKDPAPRIIATTEGELDKNGGATFTRELSESDLTGQFTSLVLRARVADRDGHPVEASRATRAFRADRLIGLEAPAVLTAGRPAPITIVAIHPDDSPLAGVWVHLRADVAGAAHLTAPDEPEGSPLCNGTTNGSGQYHCEFTPPSSGQWVLTAETTASGRSLRASVLRSASAPSTARSDVQGAALEMDPAQVEEEAAVTATLRSPFPQATALITVEREDILWRRAIPVAGTARIRIPVMPAWVPGVDVTATVVPRGIGGAQGRAAFARRWLAVNPARPDTQVTLDQPRYEPGARAVATIVTTSHHMQHDPYTSVTAWVVDERALGSGGPASLDPADALYVRRPPHVTGGDSRMIDFTDADFRWVNAPAAAKLVPTGWAAGAGDAARDRDFNPLSIPELSGTEKSRGQYRLPFTVPARPGSYRLSVLGVAGPAGVGIADVRFVVAGPMDLHPLVPAFARVGDSWVSGVRARLPVEVAEKVSFSAEVLHGSGVALNGNRDASIAFGPAEARFVPFDLTAGATPGLDDLRFSARMPSGVGDRAEAGIRVLPSGSEGSVSTAGMLHQSSVTETLDVPAGAKVVRVQVTAGSTPVTAFEEDVRGMSEYPYDCLEQRTSRMLALTSMHEAAKAHEINVITAADAEDSVSGWLADLPAYHCADGGLGDWPDCPSGSDLQLTAYAVDGFLRTPGHALAESDALEDATGYLQRAIQTPEARSSDSDGRVLALVALARAGRPDIDAEHRLFNARASLSRSQKAELARAMGARLGAQKDGDSDLRQLLTEIQGERGELSPKRPAPARAAMEDAPALVDALVLRALGELTPGAAGNLAVVDHLLALTARSPLVTSEMGPGLAGLGLLSVHPPRPMPRFTAKVAGVTLATDEPISLDAKTVVLPEAPDSASIPFELSGWGASPIYFTVRADYAFRDPPYAAAESYGFVVSREYTRADGTPIELQSTTDGHHRAEVRLGDILSVRVRAEASQPGTRVLVADPVPAGFEIMESHGDPHEAERVGHGDRVEWHLRQVAAGELEASYHVRAAFAGTFRAPGTHAERMYEPGVRGRAEAIEVHVAEQ
jgi:uncharacterized protein YfaS (alpha-2-macroglobulin family)